MDRARKFNELNYAGPSSGPNRMKQLEIYDFDHFLCRKSFQFVSSRLHKWVQNAGIYVEIWH